MLPYEELDILDIQHRIMLKRMIYAIEIIAKPGTAMQTISKDAHNTSWISKTKIMMTEIGLNYETLGTLTYNEAKKNILSAVKRAVKQSTSKTGREKSEYIYLTDNKTYTNKRPYYLDKLPRQQVRAIFMTRTRMFNPIDPNPAISARAVFPQSGCIRPEKRQFFQNFPYFTKLEPSQK